MSVSAKRNARIEITSSAAGMDSGLNDARRKMRGFAREQAKAAKDAERAAKKKEKDDEKARARSAKAASGLGKSAAMGVAAAAGFDVAGGIGGLVEDVFDTEKEMTRFAIDAQLGADKVAQFRDELMKTSEATGVSRNSLVKGAHAYQILTGDADGAVKSARTFADVVNASGANMEDVAASAASLRQNLGLDPKDFRKGFDVLLNLGHKGSMELRDFAGEMSGLAPQFKQFGDKGSLDKLTEMGAAMEVVKFNFANASETATGFRAAMTAISKTKVADKLAAAGIQVWRIDPKTKAHVKRDFFDIIADIKKKVPDQKVLADILGGRQESFRAITAMLEHYEEMVKLRDEAANSDQVSVDAHRYMESASGRIAKAWEHIKNAIAQALTPERIEQFASAITKAADAFTVVVQEASEAYNMFSGEGHKDERRGLAEQEMFLDPVFESKKGSSMTGWENVSQEEARQAAIEKAQRMVRGEFNTDESMAAEHGNYGGRENMQQAARDYLRSEGQYGVGKNLDIGAIIRSTVVEQSQRIGRPTMGPKEFADAMVDAMRRAGIGTTKIGAEPIQKAVSNNVLHRTRPGGR